MKNYKVVLYHSNLRLQEQSDIKADFQENINTETEKEVVTDHTQILVDILKMLRYEHQLTKTFQLILTESDHLFFNEYQVMKRINHIRQNNSKTYSYQLYCEKSEVEMLIVKWQNTHKTLHDAVLVIREHESSNYICR